MSVPHQRWLRLRTAAEAGNVAAADRVRAHDGKHAKTLRQQQQFLQRNPQHQQPQPVADNAAPAAAPPPPPAPVLPALPAAALQHAQLGAAAPAAAAAVGAAAAPQQQQQLHPAPAADNGQATIPLEELAATAIQMVQHIPASGLNTVAALYQLLCRDVVLNPTPLNWWRLFAFPKLCLYRLSRGGTKNVSKEFSDRCKLFVQRQYHQLWRKAKDAAAPRVAPAADTHRFAVEDLGVQLGFDTDVDAGAVDHETQLRAVRLAKAGNLARANASLSAAQLAAPDVANADKMRRLHPQSAAPQIPVKPAFLALDRPHAAQIKSLMRTFPPMSAAGLSGLTPGHLLQLVTSPSHNVAEPLAEVVAMIALGQVEGDIRRYIFGARLHGFNKKDGGIRPIACGDVLRRLAAKWLMQQARSRINGVMPYQVGVGFPNGVDVAVQSTRLFVDQAKTAQGKAAKKCVASVDISNAFNTLNRTAMLAAIAKLAPYLLDYAICAYGEGSRLYYGEHVIESTTGPQQGDPLSSLFFPLALAAVYTSVADLRDRIAKIDVRVLYQDDINLCGNWADVKVILERLVAELAKIGLNVNVRKTVVYAPADVALGATDYPVVDIDKLVVLGCPVGGGVDELLKPAVDKWEKQLAVISALPHKHVALALLHYCASSAKVMHLMRGLGNIPLWRRCDDLVAKALFSIVGGLLPPKAYSQATAPLRFGGLGIRQIAIHATVAHCVSLRRAIEHHQTLCSVDHTAVLRDRAVSLANACTSLATTTTFKDKFLDVLRSDGSRVSAKDLQSSASHAIEEQRHNARLADPTLNVRERSRIIACTAKYTGLVFYGSVFTTAARLWLDDVTFVTAARLRLGIPLGPERPCLLCHGKDKADALGDHSLSCMSGGNKTLLHHEVLDVVFDLASKLGGIPAREAHPFPDAADINLRMDVVVRCPGDRDKALLCDVAIVNPLARAHLNNAAARDLPAGAATAYEATKVAKYGVAAAALANASLRPLVFDTFGALSETCVTTVKDFAMLWAGRAGLTRSAAMRIVAHRLVYTIVRGAARIANLNAVALADRP